MTGSPIAFRFRCCVSSICADGLRSEYDVFRQALEKLRPAAVMVPGDRETSPVPAFLKAASDLGIPIVNAGFGSPFPEGVALSRVGFPRFSLEWRHFPPLLNFVAGLLFPRQVYNAPQGRMLFSPAWLTFAHASLGMLSDNPWVQGGGLSDHVLQHDARRRQGFLDLGVPARNLSTSAIRRLICSTRSIGIAMPLRAQLLERPLASPCVRSS